MGYFALEYKKGYTTHMLKDLAGILLIGIILFIPSFGFAAVPTISSPVPGATLSGSIDTFTWTDNGTAVTDWGLVVGSTLGGYDVLDTGPLGSAGVLSYAVTGIPTDGRTIYVRLWYKEGGTWQWADFHYTAFTSVGTPPTVTAPVSGATLSGATETFTWADNGTAVTDWGLVVGSTLGGFDVLDTGSLGGAGVLSYAVTGIPTDGRTIYVRLWYKEGGTWQWADFQYTAFVNVGNAGDPPSVTAPVPGATLSGATETFTWADNGTAVTDWGLVVGSTLGGFDVLDTGSLGGAGVLSYAVTGIPTDGRTIYVRLWYKEGGTWQWADFQYTAFTSVGTPPTVTAPVSGATLSGATETFTWADNGTAVTDWGLVVGSTLGGFDVLDTGSLGGAGVLSYAVTGIPTDGRTIYVRLWYKEGGTWQWADFQYTAFTSVGTPPTVTAPVSGATLSGATETFTWADNGTAVTDWGLVVGSTLGGYDVLDTGPLGSAGVLSYAVTGIPTDGRTIYVRLWYKEGGTWQWADFQYTAFTSVGTPPTVTAPVSGATLSGATETFTWADNGTAVTDWGLVVGSTLGGYDVLDTGPLGSAGVLSYAVTGIPTDGRTIYVRLWYKEGGTWQWADFQYTAFTSVGTPPTVTAPVSGATLSGATETFTWADNGTAVTDWGLVVGSTLGGYDVLDTGPLGSAGVLSYAVTGIPTDGRTIYVRLWYKEGGTWQWADFQYTAVGCCPGGNLTIDSPSELEVVSSTTVPIPSTISVNMDVTATGFPSNWGVEFVIDGTSVNMDTEFPYSYVANLAPGEHSLIIYMVDELLVRQAWASDQTNFGVGDYYVAFGDSITAETGGHDDIPGDDTSADGRNTGGGYQPILNDLLTNSKGYSHTVENEGVSGNESIDGVNRISSVLAAHPNAKYFLILLGTNDSFGPVPSGVGLNCTGLDLPSNDPGCPGTYKDNMQKIITAIVQAGKIPLLAKVPIRYGDCDATQCWSYTNPYTHPDNLLISQEYNVAIDELIASNFIEGTLGNPLNAPDLYTYFEGTQLDATGTSVEYDDFFHPGGLGYQSIGNLWKQALTE